MIIEFILKTIIDDYPEVQRVLLFGSRVRHDYHAKSDIDIAIECPNISKCRWNELWYILVHDNNTLLGIDCIRLEEAPLELYNNIIKEGIVLYERPKV